jgi:hypothetical protein
MMNIDTEDKRQTFPVEVTRDISDETTHSSVVFNRCVAVGI